MPSPSDPARLAAVARRASELLLHAESSAWLRGDAARAAEMRHALGPCAKVAGLDPDRALEMRHLVDRRKLSALQDSLAALVWSHWVDEALDRGHRGAELAASMVDTLARNDARVRGRSVAQAAVEATFAPKTRHAGLMAMMRPALIGAAGPAVARGFVSALDFEDRLWPLVGLFRAREHVVDVDATVAALTRVAVAHSGGDEWFDPALDAIPIGANASAQFFRFLQQSSPRSFVLALSCALIRRLGRPLPPPAAQAIRPWLDRPPFPLARLAGELLAGSPALPSVRNVLEADLRHPTLPLRPLLDRLAALPLAPNDPIIAFAAERANRGDDLDRAHARGLAAALDALEAKSVAWDAVRPPTQTDLERVPEWSRTRAVVGDDTPLRMGMARRLQSYLDDIDPLLEYLGRGLALGRSEWNRREHRLTGHVAAFQSDLDPKTQAELVGALNRLAVPWLRVGDPKRPILLLPSEEPDPVRAVHALVQAMETLPTPRPGLAVCAGSVAVVFGAGDASLVGPAFDRVRVLARVVRPGQFLLAEPVDPEYSARRVAAYADGLRHLNDPRGEARPWGDTRLPDGRLYALWCILSARLDVYWPATELRAR